MFAVVMSAMILAAPPAPRAEVWVFDVLDLVLRHGADVDKSWFGKARWLAGARGRGVTASLERAALPPEITSWMGRDLFAYDLEGHRCLKRIESLSVEAWLVGAKTPAEAIERGDRFLKASLKGPPCGFSPQFVLPAEETPIHYRKAPTDRPATSVSDGHGNEGQFAREAKPTQRMEIATSGDSPALTQRAIAAFRATTTWKNAQKEFTAWDPTAPPPTPTWDVLFGTEPRVTRWLGSDGSILLVVSADTRSDYPSPGQVATAVFKLDSDHLTLVTAAPTSAPMTWVDLEADGRIEAIDWAIDPRRSLRIGRWHPEGTSIEGALLFGQLEVLTDFVVPRDDTP